MICVNGNTVEAEGSIFGLLHDLSLVVNALGAKVPHSLVLSAVDLGLNEDFGRKEIVYERKKVNGTDN